MRPVLPQDRLQREILPQGLRDSTVTQPKLPSCLLFSPVHEEQARFKAQISVLKRSPAMRMRKGHSQSVSLHVNHNPWGFWYPGAAWPSLCQRSHSLGAWIRQTQQSPWINPSYPCPPGRLRAPLPARSCPDIHLPPEGKQDPSYPGGFSRSHPEPVCWQLDGECPPGAGHGGVAGMSPAPVTLCPLCLLAVRALHPLSPAPGEGALCHRRPPEPRQRACGQSSLGGPAKPGRGSAQ